MVWSHLDLASIRLFKRELPIAILIIVDALGFLSFLALLIANGIVASRFRWWRSAGYAVLLAYASVPWMFSWSVEPSLESVSMLTYHRWCSAIHGFILLQNVIRAVQSRRCSVCPNCRRGWETTAAKWPIRANYSHVVSGYESDDVEATPPGVSGYESDDVEATPPGVSGYESDDVEATPPGGSDTSEGHEQAPEMQQLIDTTNETSRLMHQSS